MKVLTVLFIVTMLGGCGSELSDHQRLIYRCANAKVPSADRNKGGGYSEQYDKALYECEKENPQTSIKP